MYKIGVLALDGFALMSYASLVEPLRAANLLSEKPLYQIINITSNSNFALSPTGVKVDGYNFREVNTFLDLVVVVAGGDPFLFENKSLLTWFNRVAKFGTCISGVSGGPVILVRAGLMSGRRMTVHWEHAVGLKEINQHIVLEKTLYVIDRDRMTCAGGTAPMDMILALISSQQGTVFAQLVSDWFMHTEIRPAEGPQRAGIVERIGSNNPTVLSAVKLMESHLSDPLNLTQLAGLCSVSGRQLNRLFKIYLGCSTMKYYSFIRVESAKSLIRNSALGISEISEASGFSNSSHFSSMFFKLNGLSPRQYRKALPRF